MLSWHFVWRAICQRIWERIFERAKEHSCKIDKSRFSSFLKPNNFCHILASHQAGIIVVNIYGWNQPGREKANKLGILSFTCWVLLTTYIFFALLEIVMCFKHIEASHIMAFNS